jgi:LCP family protein required for cell wall assembly
MKLLPHTRRGALLRCLVAAGLVIAFAASTTAVAGLLQFKQFAADLSFNKPLHAPVQIPPPGAPQTLLLIGSDHRAGEPYSAANTDTMLLVRLDPASKTINMLSIPRDLKVQIPEGGTTVTAKLNAAYSVGGPGLLLRTLKSQVLPGFEVNHIIDINFGGFSNLINAIGCVYAMVDQRYYNVSAPGIDNFSSIDIAPGYQKLCGGNNQPDGALAFVRFRHTDDDIIRNARQQDFLRWARQDYSVSQLIANRNSLVKLFGEDVQTDSDLHSTDGLINLFDLIVNMGSTTIKQIPFPYVFGPCNSGGQTPCYVLARSSAAEARAYQELMAPTTSTPASQASTGGGSAPRGAHHGEGSSSPRATPGVTPDPADGKAQAAALRHPGLPVYYPRVIATATAYCSSLIGNCDSAIEPASAYAGEYPRAYLIHGRSGHTYSAYVMTIVQNSLMGQYYNVQGTTWQEPPILRNPTQIQVIDGRKLFEYFNGSKLSLVAWHTPQGVYWIANTLDDSVGNHQLEAIAASLTRAG